MLGDRANCKRLGWLWDWPRRHCTGALCFWRTGTCTCDDHVRCDKSWSASCCSFSDRQTARCIAQIKATIDERAIPTCRKQAIGKIFAVNSEVCERYAVSGGETGAGQARPRF